MNAPRKEKGHGGNRGAFRLAGIGKRSTHNPTLVMRLAHYGARCGVNLALWSLARYAFATDTPAHGVVEAADLLDLARDALDGAP